MSACTLNNDIQQRRRALEGKRAKNPPMIVEELLPTSAWGD